MALVSEDRLGVGGGGLSPAVVRNVRSQVVWVVVRLSFVLVRRKRGETKV